MMLVKTLLLLVLHFAYGHYMNSLIIRELTPQSLDDLAQEDTNELWLVQMYRDSDGDFKEYSEDFERLALAMEGYVKVGAVNMNRYPLLSLVMQIKKTPKFYFYGYYKRKPEHVPRLNSIADIYDETSKRIAELFENRGQRRFTPNRNNVELNLDDWESHVKESHSAWVIVSYISDCPKCFDFTGTWNKLIESFKEKIKFGSINNSTETLPVRENGQMYPIVMYFARGNKHAKQVEIFDNDLEYGKLSEYLNDKIKYPKLQQITSKSAVEPCLKRNLCVFAFLPKCSTSCRLNSLRLLRDGSKKYKNRSWMWMWSEAGEQPDIEKAFALDDTDSIGENQMCVVVLNVPRVIFTKHHLLDVKVEDDFYNFLERVSFGNCTFTDLIETKEPKIRNVKPWITSDERKREEL